MFIAQPIRSLTETERRASIAVPFWAFQFPAAVCWSLGVLGAMKVEK
jgi:hypothetical protein